MFFLLFLVLLCVFGGFLCWVDQELTFTEIVKIITLALIGALVSGFITFGVISWLFNFCIVPCTGSGLSEMSGFGYYLYGVPMGMILGGIVALLIQVRRYKKFQVQLSAYYRSMYEKRKNDEKAKRY